VGVEVEQGCIDLLERQVTVVGLDLFRRHAFAQIGVEDGLDADARTFEADVVFGQEIKIVFYLHIASSSCPESASLSLCRGSPSGCSGRHASQEAVSCACCFGESYASSSAHCAMCPAITISPDPCPPNNTRLPSLPITVVPSRPMTVRDRSRSRAC